jgi:hypothetical protein
MGVYGFILQNLEKIVTHAKAVFQKAMKKTRFPLPRE